MTVQVHIDPKFKIMLTDMQIATATFKAAADKFNATFPGMLKTCVIVGNEVK